MDVFYPLRAGASKHQEFELRYSLRSIETHLKGFDRVFISTTNLPDWLTNVVHLPIADNLLRDADYNIMRKVYQADGISENFLFFNDDHFLLQDYEITTFPNYYHSTLELYCNKRGLDTYGRKAQNTLKYCTEHNYKTLFFDIHYPIIYNLSKFREVMDAVPWSDKKSFLVKSVYGNSVGLQGSYIHDGKGTNVNLKLPVFSTYPHMKPSLLTWLQSRFPNKSKFEL